MICPRCLMPIPEPLVFCQACIMRESMERLIEQQVDAVRRMLANREPFITVAQLGKRHIKTFGAEKTFCGADVKLKDRRGFLDPQIETLNGICLDCRRGVESVMEKVKHVPTT